MSSAHLSYALTKIDEIITLYNVSIVELLRDLPDELQEKILAKVEANTAQISEYKNLASVPPVRGIGFVSFDADEDVEERKKKTQEHIEKCAPGVLYDDYYYAGAGKNLEPTLYLFKDGRTIGQITLSGEYIVSQKPEKRSKNSDKL